MTHLKRLVYKLRELAARFVNVNVSSNHTIIYKAAVLIASEKIEGDCLEFGVFRGSSFISHYNVMKSLIKNKNPSEGWSKEDALQLNNLWNNMRFFAFDSFQGLPNIEGVDKQGNDFSEGKYTCSEEDFLRAVSSANLPMEKVFTVPGWYRNTLNVATREKFNLTKAAIIHIDCDLYESTKEVLKFVETLLIDGTIVIFDDWYAFRGHPDRGEQKAFREWKLQMPDWHFTQFQKEGPYRNSFIANNVQ
jgi:O-methyltransferase